MKAGEEFTCPYCHKNTFLKLVPLMDNWTKKGDALACASCSEIIEEIKKKQRARRCPALCFLQIPVAK